MSDQELIEPKSEVDPTLSFGAHFESRFAKGSAAQIIYPLSPSNLALPFPGYFRLGISGTMVRAAEAQIGWLHQGVEKMFEHCTWHEGIQLAMRLNPRFPAHHALIYMAAVEKMHGFEGRINQYTKRLRTLALECNHAGHHLRIISKLAAIFLSSSVQNAYTAKLARLRELSAPFLKNDDGSSRFDLGNARPIDQQRIEELSQAFAKESEALTALASDLLDENELSRRLTKLAPMSRDEALSFGLSGPTLRSTGVRCDVRQSHPYLAYSDLIITVPTRTESDAWARCCLRLDEISQSYALIGSLLKSMLEEPPSLHSSDSDFDIDKQKPAHGIVTVIFEAPEGMLHYTLVSNGGETPYRARIKSPAFSMLSAAHRFLRGVHLRDLPLVLHGLGIEGLEVDR